jgi:hypothetical protein
MQARANAFGVVTGACIFGKEKTCAFGAGNFRDSDRSSSPAPSLRFFERSRR